MNPAQLLTHFDRISDAPDAIPRLRQFILDLAVRGKLVEQDRRGESAFELLKRIQEEKARLVKKGMIRWENPQDQIEADEIPFPIPDHWAWARLGSVIHLVSGQHLQPSEYSGQQQSGPPYITGPADFGQNGLVITRYAVVRKAVANKGQILLTVKGAGVGKTAICNLPEVAISRQLMAMTAIEWSQQFLLLVTHRLAETLKDNARSLIPGISREDVDQFIFPLPPLAEQHRIVAKVDELMTLCDRLEAAQTERESRRDQLVTSSLYRLNNGADSDSFRDHARFYFNHLPSLTTRTEHIQKLRQTILGLAVRGKLVHQDPKDEPATELLKHIQAEKARLVNDGKIRKHSQQSKIAEDEIPFALPPQWAWTRFGDVIYLLSGQHLQPSEYTDKDQSGPPYVTGPADFRDDGLVITRYAVVRKAVAKEGQILLTVKGAGVGKTAICDLPEVAISRQLMAMTAIKWNQQFLLLATHRLAETLKENARSLIPGISRENVDQFVLALPPLAEQQRIVAKVDELMAFCDKLDAQLTTSHTDSRRLLDAILHDALASAG